MDIIRNRLWTAVTLSLVIGLGAASGASAQQAGGTFTGTGVGTGTGAGGPNPSTPQPGKRKTRGATAANPQTGAPGTNGAPTASGPFANKPPAAELPVPSGTYDAGHGFTFQFNYTGEAAGNPFGGIKQGGRYADQILLGMDVDTQKAFGVGGGVIHVLGVNRDGNEVSNSLIGNSVSFQEIFGDAETQRLVLLSYEQKFLNDHLDIEFGRFPAQASFLTSPLYCNFQNNAICGSPEIIFSDTNFTSFPLSTYAVRAKYFFTDTLYVHAGAFEVLPNATQPNDHGLNFDPTEATGVSIPVELGYSTTAANDRYPRNYSIGAIIDPSRYNDPSTDVNGGNLQTSGLTARTDVFRTLAYGRFDQTVYRPDPSATRQLQIFGFALGGTSGRQPQDFQVEGGALYTGPFDGRPYDTIGFAVSDQHYSALGLSNVRTALAAEGITRGVNPDETFFELNYGIQVNPAVRVMPNLQYVLNPDQLRFPARPNPIPDALVIGAKLSVDIFTLAGVAKGPGSS